MDPQEYGLQILNKGAKTIQWEKTVFSAKMLEQLDTYMQKNEILDTDFTPFTKTNSKWFTDLNVQHKTMKLLEDNIGENLNDLVYGNDFQIQHQRHNPWKK